MPRQTVSEQFKTNRFQYRRRIYYESDFPEDRRRRARRHRAHGPVPCGSKTEDNKADGKTYKVGIVQFVDDASLNQIEAAIEAELDAKATELGLSLIHI